MKKEVETRVRDLHILSIVQKCTGWMEQVPKRLQTEGIFRVSGSAKAMEILLERLEHEAASGRVSVDLDAENIHTVAGVFKRALMKLEPCLIPAEALTSLLQHLNDAPLQIVSGVRTAMALLSPERLHLLRHVLLFLRKSVSEEALSRMGVCNIAKVFAATLLRHPDDLRTALNLGCGRLPKIAAVMLVSDAVLDTPYDPDRHVTVDSAQVSALVAKQFLLIDQSNGPKFTCLAADAGGGGGVVKGVGGEGGGGGGVGVRGWIDAGPNARICGQGGLERCGGYVDKEAKEAKEAYCGQGGLQKCGGERVPAHATHVTDAATDATSPNRLSRGLIGVQLPWEKEPPPQPPSPQPQGRKQDHGEWQERRRMAEAEVNGNDSGAGEGRHRDSHDWTKLDEEDGGGEEEDETRFWLDARNSKAVAEGGGEYV